MREAKLSYISIIIVMIVSSQNERAIRIESVKVFLVLVVFLALVYLYYNSSCKILRYKKIQLENKLHVTAIHFRQI